MSLLSISLILWYNIFNFFTQVVNILWTSQTDACDPSIWLLAQNMTCDSSLFNLTKIGKALLIDDDTRAWMLLCEMDRDDPSFNSTKTEKTLFVDDGSSIGGDYSTQVFVYYNCLFFVRPSVT